MTKKTIERFYSDLTGDQIDSANPTVQFALDRTTYEIDLTEAERDSLGEALAPYIDAARAVGRKLTAPQRSGPPASEIRGWAIEQGIEIPARGRIPLEIRRAYNQAQ